MYMVRLHEKYDNSFRTFLFFRLSVHMMSKRTLLAYVKVVLVLVSMVMIMVLYFSTKLPFSSIYTLVHKEAELKNMADRLNKARLERAVMHFKIRDRGLPPVSRLGSRNNSLVICIVTMDRSRSAVGGLKHRYLVQTAAAVDQLLHRDTNFENKMLFICNVDERPQNHQDAIWLQNFLQFVQKHGSSSFNIKFSSVTRKPSYDSFLSDWNHAKRQKEANDYVFCLNASSAFNSSYVLMLEDDVVPSNDMLDVVSYVMRHRLHVNHDEDTGSRQPREFSYIKLYYPEKWQGYAWEMDRLLELISFGFIGAGLIYCLSSVLFTFCGKHYLPYNNLNFLLGFFLFVCIASLLNRQALLDLRRVSPQLYKFGPSPRCCTPGMLYNSKHLPKLMDFVIQHTDVNKDLAIYDFTEESVIPGFLIEPNLLHHIGMYSSLFEEYKSPREFLFSED